MSLALIFPLFLLSGILWPVISMPVWLQYVSTILPLTDVTTVITSLILRETVSPLLVLRSILVPVGWITLVGALTKMFILDTLHRG